MIDVRFPRVRGDVPTLLTRCKPHLPFSPRARGCSLRETYPHVYDAVFPACAGMFLQNRTPGQPQICFPRVRGDVPCVKFLAGNDPLFSPRARGCSGVWDCSQWVLGFSPRARGCSDSAAPQIPAVEVFPACAGMFLYTTASVIVFTCFPRVRGDVP